MWNVNGLIIRIFRQWREDIYRWREPRPEEGQFIWKCFTFAGDRPVSNNKHILSDDFYWNSNHLLSPDTPATHTHTQTFLFSLPTFSTFFYERTNTETWRSAPTGNWREEKKEKTPETIAPTFISITLTISLDLCYFSVSSCTDMLYCRRGRQ